MQLLAYVMYREMDKALEVRPCSVLPESLNIQLLHYSKLLVSLIVAMPYCLHA